MTTFLHSGALGDIVYSLPTIYTYPRPYTLYLQPEVRSRIPEWAGTRQSVLMTTRQAEQLLPLLKLHVEHVELCRGQPVDVNLDDFRTIPLDLSRYHIGRYYALAFGRQPVLHEPWLRVEPDPAMSDTILVNRTPRYRNAHISYASLRNLPNAVFVGLPDDFSEFKQDCPTLPFITAANHLQLAQWIAGCKLFVGNQSFCYALAEAMKTPRVVEIFPHCCNAAPIGPNAFDVLTQEGFDKAVAQAVGGSY